MAAYLWVKYLHVGSVILSLSGFAVRGALMLAASPLLNARWVRVAPHIVDTLLLASAAWLAWVLQQYPFVHGWLTAKVVGLLAYIGFGMVALRRGRTKRVRAGFLLLAVLSAAYVVWVALTRDPAAPIAWFILKR